MKNNNKFWLHFIILMAGITMTPILRAQGLQFRGNKESTERRTSYLVFNQSNTPKFTHILDINFELKIQDFETFGYLLHIVDPQTNAAYSFTYTYIDNKSSAFKFNTEGKENHISMSFANDSIKLRWIPVRLYIDLTTGANSLTILGRTIKGERKIVPLKQLYPLICFGRREHLLDVPSFAIRQLNIIGAQQSYSIPLNESQGENVHDSKGDIQGTVYHPYWLMNDAYHWKKLVTFGSPQSIGSKFNNTTQEILFITPDSLFTYQVGKRQFCRKAYMNNIPVEMRLGTSFLDEASQKLYAYEINNLPAGHTTMAALDLHSLTWFPIGEAFTNIQLHHHNGFWDHKRNRYLVFGGFGNRQYSNHFLTYNAQVDRWDTLHFKGERIAPRFFTSMASSPQKDYLYIYGGVGNESGDQSVGHNYYSDLYRIDLEKQIIKKCWKNQSNEKQVSAGRMVLSADEQSLYLLRYAEYKKPAALQLYRIAIKNGDMEQLGDSISFLSASIASNIALYYNTTLNEFYTVIHEFNEETENVQVQTSIYVLSSPPVSKDTIELYEIRDKASGEDYVWWTIVILISLFSIFLCLFLYQRKRRTLVEQKLGTENTSQQCATLTMKNETLTTFTPAPTTTLIETKKRLEIVEYNKIYIYGIFTVYGKSGRDITYLFSNKLKHIFLYMLLNSQKEGASSISLNDIFWSDKTEEKAKNLKGVTVSNLRKVLSEIEGIELVYEKGFFKVVITPPCYCDFFYLHEHLIDISQNLDHLLPIWERGRLLENVKLELFDKYKHYSEDIIFSSLPAELSLYFRKGEFKKVLRICTVLRKRDPLSELALLYSIHTHNRTNEIEGLSRIYTSFIIEYRNTMGEDYAKSVETLLQERLEL